MIDQNFSQTFTISNKVADLGKLWRTSTSNIVTITTSREKIQYKTKIAITKTIDLQIRGQLQLRGDIVQLVIFAPGLEKILKMNNEEIKDLAKQANNEQNPSLVYKVDNNCFCLQYYFKEYELECGKFMRRFQETSDSLKKVVRDYRREKIDSRKGTQILYLKYVIEKRRRNQDHCSACTLMQEKVQLGQNTYLLGTTKLRKQRGDKQFYDFQKKTKMETNFDALCKRIEKQNKRENRGEPILRSIDFIDSSIKESQTLEQGGMGRVRRIISRYMIKGSVHDAVNQQMEAQNTPHVIEQKEECSELVEKKGLEGKNEQLSFQIQKKFLLTYKNYHCRHIASYFIESSEKPDLSTQIFSTFYPFAVEDYLQKHHSPEQLLEVVEQICRGVHFLHGNRIIHRDLKFGNLRLDKNGLVKIIDFGSVAPIDGESPSWYSGNPQFCGTKPYYLNYSLLPQPLKKVFTESSFHRHALFDVYSMGIIIEKLLQLTPYSSKNFYVEMVKYVYEKCQEHNPFDRMSPLEILGFINVGKKSSILSEQFKGFLESFE